MIGYINGIQVRSISVGSSDLGTNNGNLVIGGAPWIPDTLNVDGIIDEVHISASVRNACWIETEYDNQNNPGSFYSLGSEERLGHTITASAGADGLISPSGQVSVNPGTDKTFTITPDGGYQVSEVWVDGNPVSLTNGQYTFTSVSGDHTIYATFEIVDGDFNWSEGDFAYRKQISVSQTMLPSSCSSNLANYPLLIKIDNDNDLKEHVQSPAGCLDYSFHQNLIPYR